MGGGRTVAQQAANDLHMLIVTDFASPSKHGISNFTLTIPSVSLTRDSQGLTMASFMLPERKPARSRVT
jgi:hypothetical protein